MARARDEARQEEGGGYRGPTPPPVEPPSWRRRVFVERPADLAALAAELAAAHVIAIDAEFVQPRMRSHDEPPHRLALLQLAIDNEYRASYVVDTLRLADLSRLQQPLENGAILKLFHGVSADARVLATRSLYARHILDLEAVSRSIFGQRESSLQAMLQRACGVRLDKSFQRADWSRRPLTPAMIAYAARDAEMTYALYGWLQAHYPRAVAAHELPAVAAASVAAWILPALESPRLRSVEQSLDDAGLSRDTATQRDDLAQALAAVTLPSQRTRLMRLISDLELAGLAPELRPYLSSQAAEERAGAARALGRLRDWQSQQTIEVLLHDPVQDVRQAAQIALEVMKKGPTQPAPRRERAEPGSRHQPSGWHTGPRTWVVEGETTGAEAVDANDWRAALRQRFGGSGGDPDGHDADAEPSAPDAESPKPEPETDKAPIAPKVEATGEE
jgi:hypothetical protein